MVVRHDLCLSVISLRHVVGSYAMHYLFLLICNLNYVHVNENILLHLWCRRKGKIIKLTGG